MRLFCILFLVRFKGLSMHVSDGARDGEKVKKEKGVNMLRKYGSASKGRDGHDGQYSSGKRLCAASQLRLHYGVS